MPARTSALRCPPAAAACRSFAGVGAYLAVRTQETGTGPGVCLISTQLEASAPSGVALPGAAAPKPTKTLTVAQTVCQSETVLSGYVGALGDSLPGSGARLVLVPDGVSAITYTLANGHLFTVPVAAESRHRATSAVGPDDSFDPQRPANYAASSLPTCPRA